MRRDEIAKAYRDTGKDGRRALARLFGAAAVNRHVPRTTATSSLADVVAAADALEARLLFDSLDVDGDGRVSVEDLAAAVATHSSGQLPDMTMASLEDMVRVANCDGRGLCFTHFRADVM